MSDSASLDSSSPDPELAEYVEAIGAVGKRAVFEIGKILIAAKAHVPGDGCLGSNASSDGLPGRRKE